MGVAAGVPPNAASSRRTRVSAKAI
jgi:hypothetical protein